MASKKKRYNIRNLPPCPDTLRYVLASDADGYYWRLRRGCGKEAPLNAVMSRIASLTGPTNAGASNIRRTLAPYLHGIGKNELHGRLAGLLKKAINSRGKADFTGFTGFDFQKAYPFDQLVSGFVVVEVEEQAVRLSIPIDENAIKAHNKLVTEFYFEAIMLYGDAMMEDGLRTYHEESPLYRFDEVRSSRCLLELEKPSGEVPWMVLLKMNCLEGKELAMHPKHYGLKVMTAG